MKKLQKNGLPINGVFDEISTIDFADSGDVFVLKPEENEILEITGVKMFFDNNLEYKPIMVEFFMFGGVSNIVEYPKLKDWLTKSNEGVSTDSNSFIGKNIVCYSRTFTEPIYLVAENLKDFVNNGINIPAIERIEISIENNEKMVSVNGDEIEIAKGRYDVVRYKAIEEDINEWLN